MKILAIDTCFAACMIAVLDTGTGLAHKNIVPTNRGQAEMLVPLVDQLLKNSAVDYPELDLIAVNVGPGSFTGVRVGLATARGLGLALDRPVQGVGACDALYATWAKQRPTAQENVRVMIDTGREDYFTALYQSLQDVPLTTESIRIETTLPAGEGPVIGTVPGTQMEWPDPVVLAELAETLFRKADFTGRGRAEPVYMREAEVSVSKKKGRVLLDPQVINT